MKNIIHILGKVTLVLSIFFICLYLYKNISHGPQDNQLSSTNHIAFILDVSRSMNIADMDNTSRLSAAKQKIYDIMSESRGYDFALSIFAGESQRVLPFTGDISLFATFLRGIDSNNLTLQGTDIDKALTDALQSFGSDYAGDIIILTDGAEDEIQFSRDIQKALETKNIHISIIGVGSLEGGPIPTGNAFDPYKTYQGKIVKLGLNEKGLKDLAKQLGGKYYDVSDVIDISQGEGLKFGNQNEYLYLLLAFLSWIAYLATIFYIIYYAKK